MHRSSNCYSYELCKLWRSSLYSMQRNRLLMPKRCKSFIVVFWSLVKVSCIIVNGPHYITTVWTGGSSNPVYWGSTDWGSNPGCCGASPALITQPVPISRCCNDKNILSKPFPQPQFEMRHFWSSKLGLGARIVMLTYSSFIQISLGNARFTQRTERSASQTLNWIMKVMAHSLIVQSRWTQLLLFPLIERNASY